jgi:hypothetical protein
LASLLFGKRKGNKKLWKFFLCFCYSCLVLRNITFHCSRSLHPPPYSSCPCVTREREKIFSRMKNVWCFNVCK